jgi:subtilisin family serine protease
LSAARGILFVAAAGNENSDNDGGNPAYPASYKLSNIISVGAVDRADQEAWFSNFG